MLHDNQVKTEFIILKDLYREKISEINQYLKLEDTIGNIILVG